MSYGFWFWLGVPCLLAIIALLSFIREDILAFLSERGIVRKHPQDPSLRELVASEISWKNSARFPKFYGKVLPAFHFLVDEEGFSLPRIDSDMPHLSYRKGSRGINLMLSEGGTEVAIEFVCFRTPNSNAMTKSAFLEPHPDSLGEGTRSLVFHVRANLETFLRHLRAEEVVLRVKVSAFF